MEALKFTKAGERYVADSEFDTYTISRGGDGWEATLLSHRNNLVWDWFTAGSLADVKAFASEHAVEHAGCVGVLTKEERWLSERDSTGETWIEYLRRDAGAN